MKFGLTFIFFFGFVSLFQIIFHEHMSFQTQEKIILKKQKKRLSEESADVFPVSYPMSILHFIWEIQTPQPFPQQT